MNRVRMGYYPTDLEHVQMIRKAVIFPESAVNILDPCCGEGLALETLADGEKAVTYGCLLYTSKNIFVRKILRMNLYI